MIVLFTDFGRLGPYVAQMQAVLARLAPGVPVIDLLADVPAWNARAAAYLLAAFVPEFPAGSLFVAVVDPGVGTARRPLLVEADGRRLVGPDNGLFELVLRRAARRHVWRIDWRPERLSASFHGRDLFAPVAAVLATGRDVACTPLPAAEVGRPDWPDDLAEIIYVDPFGNAVTGIHADTLPESTELTVGGRKLRRAPTFGAVATGEAFWYANANGLAEIAVNQGRADRTLGLVIGSPITVA